MTKPSDSGPLLILRPSFLQSPWRYSTCVGIGLDIDRIDACRSISGEAGTCTHPRARNWDAVSHQSSRPFAGRTDPSR